MTIQEKMRQVAEDMRGIMPIALSHDVADAVAVALLREVKNLLQAGSYVRYSTPETVIDEALAAFGMADFVPAPAPVAPPTAGGCADCGHAVGLHDGPEGVCVADCRSLTPLIQCGCKEFRVAPPAQEPVDVLIAAVRQEHAARPARETGR